MRWKPLDAVALGGDAPYLFATIAPRDRSRSPPWTAQRIVIEEVPPPRDSQLAAAHLDPSVPTLFGGGAQPEREVDRWCSAAAATRGIDAMPATMARGQPRGARRGGR